MGKKLSMNHLMAKLKRGHRPHHKRSKEKTGGGALFYKGLYYPAHYHTKVRAVNVLNDVFNAGKQNNYFFSMTNIVVPITGYSGTQCSGIYQLLGSQTSAGGNTGIYTAYIVKSFTISLSVDVEISSTGNTGLDIVMVPLPYGQTNATNTDFTYYCEAKGAKSKHYGGNAMTGALAKKLTGKYYPHKVVGIAYSNYRDNNNFWGTYQGSANNFVLLLQFATTDKANDATLACNVVCTTTYEIEFFNPNNPSSLTPS